MKKEKHFPTSYLWSTWTAEKHLSTAYLPTMFLFVVVTFTETEVYIFLFLYCGWKFIIKGYAKNTSLTLKNYDIEKF